MLSFRSAKCKALWQSFTYLANRQVYMSEESIQPILRDALESDMSSITEIYADEVLNGVSSWEEQAPASEEVISRRLFIGFFAFQSILTPLVGRLLIAWK